MKQHKYTNEVAQDSSAAEGGLYLCGRSVGIAAKGDGQRKLGLEDGQSAQLAGENEIEQ